MRNMSFKLTERQMRERRKTVTRRLGWRFAVPGMCVQAVRQCQGLKRGQKVEPICVIEFTHVCSQPLNWMDQDDCMREGFPEMTPAEFVQMFCRATGCEPETEVTRIAFVFEDGPARLLKADGQPAGRPGKHRRFEQ